MSKSKELNIVTNLVKYILVEEPQTRNSDSLLYLKVINHFAKEKGIDLSELTVEYFLTALNVLGFPGAETVRRTRQKIQQEYPYLKANATVEQFRADNEEAFKNYAKGAV
jgi:hypothetical protein